MRTTLTLALLALPGVLAKFAPGYNTDLSSVKHVVLISIDGLHNDDVSKYIKLRPDSAMANLLKTGYQYAQAYTSAPSDSFPGTLAQITGASPRTHGVWYDVIFDRSYYPPGSNCSGPAGSEVADDETLDYNSTLLFSGGINPKNLPRRIINGRCTSIPPHQRPRVNNIYELVQSAGGIVVYADKHPAYDIVRGPSGTGLTEGYFPEIAAVPNNVNATIEYDKLHVAAFLNWTRGYSAVSEKKLSDMPTIIGGNFQSVSVAQKTVGYLNETGFPFSTALISALDFVDHSLDQIVTSLKNEAIYNQTMIIIASKHGQSPVDPSLLRKIDPEALTNGTGVEVEYQVVSMFHLSNERANNNDNKKSDDIGMLFFKNPSDIDIAYKNLVKKKDVLGIDRLILGQDLIDEGFAYSLDDPAVPDMIVKVTPGVIYTTSSKKVAEHGGLAADDRHVACMMSHPLLKPKTVTRPVQTKQIAPTILKLLGLDASKLEGAVAECTAPLPYF